MFNIEKLTELERPIVDSDPHRNYYRQGEIPTTQKVVTDWQAWISKQKKAPNHHLDDVIPILLYKSHYRSDFYSMLVNLSLGSPNSFHEVLRSYFGDWLESALNSLPSFRGEVSHSIKPQDLSHPEKLAMDFEKNIGSDIRFNKFISTSKLDRECNLRFDIKTLENSSFGKEVWALLYEESDLGEQEVLFNRNADFKIVDVSQINEVWRVSLEEIAPNVNPPPLNYYTNFIALTHGET